MSTRSTAIARGVVLQVLAKFSALPLSMITLAIATRYLDAAGYGVLATAVVFVGTFEALTELGIGTVIVRRVAGHGADLERLVGMNISFSTFYALPLALLAAATGLVVYAGEPQKQLAVAIIAVGLVFSTLSSCFEPVFDVRVRYSSAASAEFLSRVLTLGAAASVATFDLGLPAMAAVQVIPQALRLVIQWWGASRLAVIRWVVDRGEMWALLKESFPLTVITIIAVLYWRGDGLILSLLGDDRQVGAYYLAVQIAFTLTLVSQVFERSVLSTINETYGSDRDRFARAVDQGYRFLLLVGIPIAVIGWPLAGRMAGLIGEEQFRPLAGPPLQLFFVAVAMTFLSAIVSDGLIAAHEQRYLTAMSTFNLVLNLAGNAVLIGVLGFGAVACGIMLVITETIGVVASQWRLRRHGVHPLPFGYIARLVPAALLALIAIRLTEDLPLIVPMAAGGIAYVVGAVLVGAVPASMRSALLGALRPKSLDAMEADAAAGPHGDGDDDVPGGRPLDAGTEAVPSLPAVAPPVPAGRRPEPDAVTTRLARVPAGAASAPAAAAAATGGRHALREADPLDLPTTELDLNSLQTIRMRALSTKVVEMRVVRRR